MSIEKDLPDSALARLEKVEKQNRMAKKLFLTALVLGGTLVVMGQARQNRVVEAERFLLKDGLGRTRARLELQGGDRPALSLLNENGFPLVSLVAGGEGSFVSLCDSPCKDSVEITLSQNVKGLAIYEAGAAWPSNKDKLAGLRVGVGVVNGMPGFDLFGKAGETASLRLDKVGPNIALSDDQGFSTTIGSAALETLQTGESHRTSAASIVLFGKSGKVLWSAP